MAVLFITHKFPPAIGGMQRQSYELINGISAQEKVYTLIQAPTESKLFFFLKLKSRVKKLLRKNADISAIHCNDGVMASFCLWLLDYTDIPLTATFHGMEACFPNQLFIQYIVPKLHKFSRIFVVSEATRRACLALGFHPNKIQLVKNGVSKEIAEIKNKPTFVANFKAQYGVDFEKDRILISVGRSTKRKGFSWFAKNVLPVLDDRIKYIIIGPKKRNSIVELLAKLLPKSLALQLELSLGYATDLKELKEVDNPNLILIDKLPYDELMQAISHADLFLMPNKKSKGDMEGFGLVALEANLRETFVLASNIEGITCAVKQNQNGKLIEERNVGQWVNNINKLLNQPEALKTKAKKAKTFALENYSWEKMSEEYLFEFQKLKSLKYEVKTLVEIKHQCDPHFSFSIER